MVISLILPQRSAIRTWFCNCPQYLCLFRIFVECSSSIHDPRKMLVLPNQFFSSTFHIGSRFCFFPANFMSSTYTDKNNSFSRWTKRHSQFGIFSQPCFNRMFSNCLFHNSPAKGWPYRFRSRGTTGSSILDHDFGHFCRGRRIQMSGHSDLGIWIICENLPLLLGYKPILRLLLVHRNPAIWRWYPWS